MIDNNPSSNQKGRVLRFRRSSAAAQVPVEGSTPVRDLTDYERGQSGGEGDADDYRHRMIVNVAAFVFIMALICAGYWLADTMARMRKNQDCVLSGRRGCTPVDLVKDRR
jgi:hypothetical protein